MKDADDIMVKDLVELLEAVPGNDSLTQAINIMYMVRGNKEKYFRVMDVEA